MPERQAYGIAEWASEDEREAACRAALRVVWGDLEWFDIDLDGLSEDPQAKVAARMLGAYRTRALLSRRTTMTAHLTPGRDDQALAAVLEVVAETIGSTGFALDVGRIIYFANDCGTSCGFELTTDQRRSVEDALREQGLREETLAPS